MAPLTGCGSLEAHNFPPMCKTVSRWFRRPKDPSGHVYYARLRAPQGTFYKLGYTSKASLTDRMRFAGFGDELLIDRDFLFAFREDAWDVEQTLLEHFDKHRAFGRYSNDPKMPLAGRGQSELFAHDILGLDSDLYRLSDEERRALKQEVAEANDGCLMALLGLVLVPFTLGLSLLFIAGGLSGIFEGGAKAQPRKTQPQHPPKLKPLIDSLAHTQPASGGLARPLKKLPPSD